MPQQRPQLQHDDNHPDAGHKPGDHRKRHQSDITPQSQQTETDLKQTAENHHTKRHRRPRQRVERDKFGQHRRHHHRHRPGRPRDLRRGTAKQRREEPYKDGTV